MQFLKSFKKREIFAYDIYSNSECSTHNYESFVREGYAKNVVVYRAITLISQCMSSVDLLVNDVDKNTRSYVLGLLYNSNSEYGISKILESIASYLLISGNAFIYISQASEKPFMQVLRPDRIEIIPNKNQTAVEQYRYRINGKFIAIDDVDNVIHLKFFNPLNDWYGLSPLQAAAQSIDQHNAVSDHNLSILQNGGRPSGCLMVKSGGENLTDQQREQLKQGLRNSYSGMKNAGKIMVLEGDFDWKEIGKTPKDLDFFAGKNISAREIAQAFGIPPMLIGIQGDSTFANYREARYHLWEDTILPLVMRFINELNRWLYAHVSRDVVISIDMDKIQSLSFKRDALWKRLSDCDFLTTNEKREILGLSPL